MLYLRMRLPRLLICSLLALTALMVCLAIAPVRATLAPASDTACGMERQCQPVLVTDAALMREGKTLYEAGQFEAAIAVLQRAAQGYQRQGDSLRQAIALSNLALAYQQLGQWQSANQAIATSITLLSASATSIADRYQASPHRVLAQALDIQGDLQLAAGQAEIALSTWQQAASLYQQLGETNGLAQNQINQAQALRVLGYYRRALLLLTELQQQLPPQASSVAHIRVLRSLGNALRLVGDLEQSRTVLQTALTQIQQLPANPDSTVENSAILFALGNTARAQQENTAALQYYQQSETLAPTLVDKVQAQVNALSLRLASQQALELQPLWSTLQTQISQLPMSQASTYLRIHLAQALLSNTTTDQAKQLTATSQELRIAAQLLAIAVQQSQQLGDRRAEAYAVGLLGYAYERTQQWTEAQQLTQTALKLAQTLNARDITYRWYWQLGRLLKQQGNPSGAIAAYDKAVADLQSLRGDLVAVNRDVQFSFRESVEPVYRESVELLVRSNNGQPVSPQNLDKARQRMEALQLAELDNFFREACLDTQPILLDKVVDQDNPTAAIIYPMILSNQLEVIVKIPQQPLHHHTVKLPKSEVEKTLKQLQENLPELDAAYKVRALSQQVYQWLITPIKPDLQRQGVNTLVFVLDGAFRSVPMAGLFDGKQYLVEQYAVALSLGLQLLPPKPLANESLHVLAAGLIEPPAQFQQQFPPLPAIKSEFELIAKTGIPTQKLLDQAFTSQSLESNINASGFNVVHLATHGQFSSQAKETFILAADGPINVTELDALLQRRNQLRSEAIELLVLSACQTAKGDDRATLGLAGVAIKAGARSTLASLWSIDDRSTAILIGEFYQALTQQKVTKAEALRRAQLALLKQHPNYTRPSYWAPYVLVGNWL